MGYFLPKKYKDLHNPCFYFHDILAKIVVEGERKKLFNTIIKSENYEDSKSSEKCKENIFEWLKTKGYKKEMELILIRQILLATLSDFCHYVYEALKCSEKGKLSITYTLLRKPFKDTLLIYEWILADRNKFLDCFQLDPEHYDIGNIDQACKKDYITKSLGLIKYKTFNADFIYDIRYSKKIHYGLEGLWNRANHIVTTCEHYKTESMNLNFVFSNNIDKEKQWHHLYILLPSLLFYTIEVVQALLDREIGYKKFRILSKTMHERAFGFIAVSNLLAKIKTENS
ncbi:MAG: hypothetical protein A3J83_03605 [Elusimicrobia bacterium RIFOXYA2_FULL_40_6]|nr:MAG: hypothetical protein A3J83_03605 [Elusimicrobia bacterium RIFOXYA2_FULL_40_6]